MLQFPKDSAKFCSVLLPNPQMVSENAIETPGGKTFVFNHLKPLWPENTILSTVKKAQYSVEVSWVGSGAEVAKNDNQVQTWMA